jgi:hypothetical protein
LGISFPSEKLWANSETFDDEEGNQWKSDVISEIGSEKHFNSQYPTDYYSFTNERYFIMMIAVLKQYVIL